jgi:peptidoglycan L-alanyl-D-glutamate endopeptidase CwlK
MASRSLDDLIPEVALKARVFIANCKDAGIDVLIYCTLRSSAEQDEIYKIGRSLPGQIVTNARGGNSWHNWGRAFDFVPMVHGKPAWGDMHLYRTCGVIAEQCELEWAGRWTGKLKETAHCQYTAGTTIEQLKAKL